jgi:hypothetical protein
MNKKQHLLLVTFIVGLFIFVSCESKQQRIEKETYNKYINNSLQTAKLRSFRYVLYSPK